MKALLSSVIVLGILMFLSGCSRITRGDGELVKNKILVKDFNQLNVAAVSADIYYVQSESTPGLSITTDRNVQEMLDIKQEGHAISIKIKEEYKGKWIIPTKFTVAVNSNTLKEINLAGSSVFNQDSPIHAQELKINMAGSSTINLEDSLSVEELWTCIAGKSTINASMLNVGSLRADLAGSGTYNLGGTAESVAFSVAGKGKIKAFDLKASTISCKVAGYANIEVYAADKLNLELAGLGIVRYKGNPSITQEGFGSVKKVD